jgi:hypothetical protein
VCREGRVGPGGFSSFRNWDSILICVTATK